MSHTTLPPAPTTGRNTRGLVLLPIGMVLSLAAAVVLGGTLLGIATLQSDALARMNEENLQYWASFGLVERQLSTLSMISAVPGVLLLAATCFLIPGYLRRRGSIMEGELKFWRGGSNTAKYKPLPLGVHAAWLGGMGGILIGLCWIALAWDDMPFFTTTLGIGVAFFGLGVALSVNYWKAGEPLGTAESYS